MTPAQRHPFHSYPLTLSLNFLAALAQSTLVKVSADAPIDDSFDDHLPPSITRPYLTICAAPDKEPFNFSLPERVLTCIQKSSTSGLEVVASLLPPLASRPDAEETRNRIEEIQVESREIGFNMLWKERAGSCPIAWDEAGCRASQGFHDHATSLGEFFGA